MSNQPLLPSDYFLMQMLADAGMEITEDDWRSFKAEVRRRALEGPQPAVVAGIETLAIISIVASVISVGLTIAASFFKPKPGAPAQLASRQQAGSNINSQRRYAPRSGFDAVQDPATIGSTIPLVYALRENTGNGVLGGVRINLPLLWSQIESLGGSQLMRAIFLLSEGPIASVDPLNFAIGNNSISSYDLANSTANALGSRLSLYFRGNGGRILSGDHLIGRTPSADKGNSQVAGGPDVFSLNYQGAWQPSFSAATRPSTQTAFGITAFIGNNLGFRVNPVIRPTVNAQLVPKGDDGDARVKCPTDDVARVARLKYSAVFSCRSGIIAGSMGAIGSKVTYVLDNTSDADTQFIYPFRTPSGLDWSIDADIISNPFGEARVTNGPLERLISISSVTSNSAAGTVTVQVRFNSLEAYYLLKWINFGTYDITYRISIIGTPEDDPNGDPQEFERRFNVKMTRQPVATGEENLSGIQIDALSYDNGNGFYTYAPVEAPTSFSLLDFSPLQATFELTFITKDQAVERCGDVASAVASRQKSWDDAIVVGDLYKVGSALAICTNRSPADAIFESDADFGPEGLGSGQRITAEFTAVRPGYTDTTTLSVLQAAGNAERPPQRQTATRASHIYRVALGNITTTRACRVVEIGIKSSLGIRINGICNFKDSLSYTEANNKACDAYKNDVIEKGETLKVDVFQSGSISTSEERFSFFRISYREAGTNAPFRNLDPCFGVRCISQQSAFNSIRIALGDTKRWEFRFEPLSGWEIRTGTATGSLELIDNKLLTNRTIFTSDVTVTYKGKRLERSYQTFQLTSVYRDDDVGIGRTDGSSYLDYWGKLAEDFVYEEAQTSVSGTPEHEIVYVNEIVENATEPNYDNLAIIGLNIRSSAEFQQFSQFSAYVTGGVVCRRLLLSNSPGPTHLFPDILLDLLTNPRYGRGDLITDELIDFDSFRESAQWCRDRNYFFDGAIVDRKNLRQWAADVAATHLLIFGEANGRFFLRPAFPTGPAPIRALFTAGNIREGSFRMQYLEAEERQPIQVSVRYREERAESNLTNPGLFPVERELLIREASVPDTAPIESVDVSDYATNERHAIDAAKFIERFRRLTTHSVRFETTYEGVLTGLAPGDFIRVAMDTNVYDEFNNGIITPTGALVSTQPLSDGTYSVIQWNGDNSSAPVDGAINVFSNGTKATPTGVVFTIKRPNRQVQTYQIESIEPSDQGWLAIEAVHMPTNDNGVLRLADGLFSDSGWIIQR